MASAIRVPDRILSGDFVDVTQPVSGDDGKNLTYDHATGTAIWTTPSGGTPGGSATHVQTNDGAGGFAGDSGFVYAGSGVATLTGRLIVPVIRPAADSTDAIGFNTASGTRVLSINTTDKTTNFISANSNLRIGGYSVDSRYMCIWVGAAGTGINESVFNAIDDGSIERQVFFNAPGNVGKLFFRQNNVTYMSLQSKRLQISTSQSAVGDGTARLTISTDNASKTALTLLATSGQTYDLLDVRASDNAVMFSIGATGKLLTNQAVANTNTPSGATAQAMPVYNASGTLLGYMPVYASAW